MKLYYKREKNEAFLSMVGVACVKSDSINPLGVIVKELTETASGRQNAAYFSLLFLQKKLLYAYMFDSFDLTSYYFPLTDHPLSIAIEKIREKKYGTIDNGVSFNYNSQKYKVYRHKKRVYIDIFQNNLLIERHWYR